MALADNQMVLADNQMVLADKQMVLAGNWTEHANNEMVPDGNKRLGLLLEFV